MCVEVGGGGRSQGLGARQSENGMEGCWTIQKWPFLITYSWQPELQSILLGTRRYAWAPFCPQKATTSLQFTVIGTHWHSVLFSATVTPLCSLSLQVVFSSWILPRECPGEPAVFWIPWGKHTLIWRLVAKAVLYQQYVLLHRIIHHSEIWKSWNSFISFHQNPYSRHLLSDSLDFGF